MSVGNQTTFWKFISENNQFKIKIPKIQRDYVQGRNNSKVEYSRERLIDEIKNSLITNDLIDLNFVYGKQNINVLINEFIPIDGQQRLTTLLILHIYSFSKDKDNNKLSILKNNFEYDTRITTSRFLNSLIDNLQLFSFDSDDNIRTFIEDEAWYSNDWNLDPSINSFLVVLEYIHKIFNNVKNLSDKLIDVNCPLTFMALKIDDVGQVNDLYIKMNSRGKPLTDFENFKSSLYDYLENINYDKKDAFKSKMEREWMSFVWDIVDTDPQKKCDNRFMLLLDKIIMNRLISSSNYSSIDTVKWNKLLQKKYFYNFDLYKPFLIDKKAIDDIYYSFEFFCYISNYLTTNSIPIWLKNLLNNDFNPGNMERVRLTAITKYAISISQANWDESLFEEWRRITDNLILNTDIDNSIKMTSACKSMINFDISICANPNICFSAISENDIDFYSRNQIIEEKIKCGLIVSNANWKNQILNAERNNYFKSEIMFALKLCDINQTNVSTIPATKIAEFETKWKLIIQIFGCHNTLDVIGGVDKDFLRRALMLYGNCYIDANSSKTFFFESSNGYYNWRRMLRENSSFSIFKLLFDNLYNARITNRIDIENEIRNQMSNYIQNPANMADEFKYYLIKYPQILDSMREKRFRNANQFGGRCILYSGANLNAEYYEALTYFAYITYSSTGASIKYQSGRGSDYNNDDTKAFICEVNGVKCHIEYNSNIGHFFDENSNPILYNGNQIVSVQNLVSYLATIS